MSESKHGGSRPNSGRKPLGDQPMVTRAFVITREQALWIETIAAETGANRSRIVREMIDTSNYARIKSNIRHSHHDE